MRDQQGFGAAIVFGQPQVRGRDQLTRFVRAGALVLAQGIDDTRSTTATALRPSNAARIND